MRSRPPQNHYVSDRACLCPRIATCWDLVIDIINAFHTPRRGLGSKLLRIRHPQNRYAFYIEEPMDRDMFGTSHLHTHYVFTPHIPLQIGLTHLDNSTSPASLRVTHRASQRQWMADYIANRLTHVGNLTSSKSLLHVRKFYLTLITAIVSSQVPRTTACYMSGA